MCVQERPADTETPHTPTVVSSQNKQHFSTLWSRYRAVKSLFAPFRLSTKGAQTQPVVWCSILHCANPRVGSAMVRCGLFSGDIFLRIELIQESELRPQGLAFLLIGELHHKNLRVPFLIHIDIRDQRTDFSDFHIATVRGPLETSTYYRIRFNSHRLRNHHTRTVA